MLKNHEGDSLFDYFPLKKELPDQYKAADFDYELIWETMGVKRQPAETFGKYYTKSMIYHSVWRGKCQNKNYLKLLSRISNQD